MRSGESSVKTGEAGTIWSRPLIKGFDGLTLRVVLFALPFAIFQMWSITTSTFQMAMSWGIPMIAWLIIEYVFMKLSQGRIQMSPQEWTIWWILTTGTGVANSLIPIWFNGPLAIRFKYPEYAAYLPDYWTIKDPAAVNNYIYGGAQVPWDLWTTPLVWWLLWATFLYFSTVALTLPMRKPYIEEERFPVPNIVETYETVKRAKAQDRPSLFSWVESKWVWIGAIIGFALYLPNFIAFLMPVPPHLFFGWIPLDLTPYLGSIFPGAELAPALITGMLPVGMFTPMDITATTFIVWVLGGIVIPGLGVKIGIFPQTPPVAWTFKNLMFMDFSNYVGGIIWGMGLWVLWHYRSRFAGTIKAAINGDAAEGTEPVSWRTNWIMYIVSTIGLIALMAMVGIPFTMVLFLVFLFQWMNGIYNPRLMAESGFWVVSDLGGGHPYVRDFGTTLGLWPEVGVTADKWRSMSMWAYFGFQGGQWTASVDAAYSIYGYKMANMTNTPAKSVFLAYSFTSIFSHVVGALIFLSVVYGMGFNTILSKWWVFGYTSATNNDSVTAFINTPTSQFYSLNMYIPVAIGTILTFATFYFRTIFPWFFLHPIGFEMATIWWLAPIFYIAWIIKYIAIKFGGPRAYDNYVLPATVGYAIGGAIANFLLVGIQWATL